MPIVTLETGQKLTFPEGTTSDQINFAVDEFVTKNGISPQEAPAQQAPAALQQAAQEPQSTALRNQQAVGNFARGIPQGLGNVAIGGVQAATDVGEKAAQLIEKLYFGDNLQMNTFGNRLAEQAKIRKEQQAQLPMSERAGIFVGEIAPTIAAGAGTGARVAAATGSRIAGIATSGGIGGATSSALSMQEEAGLGNRAVETAKGAATGAAFGIGLGVGGKVVGGVVNAGKSLFTAKSAEDILAARLPKEQTTALLEQLKTATPDNPVLLPDIAGDSIKGLTRSVAKISTGKDIVVDALENRSQGAVSRVADHLSRDISPVDAYFGNLDDLTKARSEASKPLYDKVFGRNSKPDENIELFSGGGEPFTGIRYGNVFDGIFASNNYDTATSYGNIIKKIKVNPNKIFDVPKNFQETEKAENFIKKSFPEADADTLEKLYDAIALDKNSFDDASYLNDILKISDDVGEASWSLQNTRGALASELGYDASKMRDENGISYFLPYKTKAIINDLENKGGGVWEKASRTLGATLPTKGNEELLSKIAPELKTVRNDFRLTREEAPDNSFTLLHHVKESLFDKAQVLKRQGANSQARVYDNLRVELTKKMGEISPDYKKANEVFGGFSQLKGAQEAGLDFSKLRPEEVRREIMSFSAAERDAYRIGVRENLQKTVSSTADGADPAKRIFGNEFKREQLKAVFGNEKKFAEFEQKMANEIRAADTKAKVLGGSRTDYNMAGDEEFLNKMISGGITVAKSKINPLYLLEAAYNAVTNKFAGINKSNANKLAKILVNRPNAINALEGILAKENNSLQKRVLNDAKNYILTNIATQSSMNSNNDAQAAETENMTEEQIRNQLIQRQQQEPVLMSGINPQAEAQKIKKRYYR